MTRKAVIEREQKRAKLENQYRQKREELKAKAREAYINGEIPWDIQQKLQQMPKNSHPTRKQKRCRLCGRPHAVYRRFGVCRCCLRKNAMQGYAPGVTKASW